MNLIMDLIKKNQYWISFGLGLILSVGSFILNPFGLSSGANKAVAVAILMVSWWLTEALPLPAVALIPLVLNPLLKIGTMEETARAYSNPVVFLFMGGFMMVWRSKSGIFTNVLPCTL